MYAGVELIFIMHTFFYETFQKPYCHSYHVKLEKLCFQDPPGEGGIS